MGLNTETERLVKPCNSNQSQKLIDVLTNIGLCGVKTFSVPLKSAYQQNPRIPLTKSAVLTYPLMTGIDLNSEYGNTKVAFILFYLCINLGISIGPLVLCTVKIISQN